MIGLEDVYKVVAAMVPLYVALFLGYGSVKWWHIFTSDHFSIINRLVYYFILPLFTFEFTTTINPFEMNYRFIAADVITKVIIVLVIGFWAKCSTSKERYGWSITSFCLCTLSNTLVVGVPLMKAMYGQVGVDLVVQSTVVQSILWLTLLLFVLEFRRSWSVFDFSENSSNEGQDLEGNTNVVVNNRPSFWCSMGTVWRKLAGNPNSYACYAGLVWALFSKRFHFKMPSIMEGSIQILSTAGTGTSMFSIGLFAASQDKVIACGARLTVFGMVLRFIAGPAAMAISCIAVGLRGNVLHIAIIQAALPQAIASFIFAEQYGLHADVLSTAVIFGTLVSLPVLIAYYATLEALD